MNNNKQKIKRPDSIKVGQYDYSIRFTDEYSGLIKEFEPGIQGKFAPNDNIIIVFNHTDNERQSKTTLLHEILHSVELFMNCELNEDQVTRFSNGLMMLAKDNQDLFKYLFLEE